jgi:protein TonB
VNRGARWGVALVAAAALHLLAAWGLARWRAQREPLLPLWRQGLSSVDLTLAAPAPPPPSPEPPPPPPPAPAPPPPVEPLPAVVLSEPPPEPSPPEPPAHVQVPPAPPEAEPEPPAPDADLAVKGVEEAVLSPAEVRPRYPLGARMRGEEGLVRLRVEVSAAGRARDVTVVESSGYPSLDRAAERAAWEARYGETSGRTGAGVTTFGVRFRLED